MAELTPSTLETVSSGQTQWHTVYNTNFEKINNKLGMSIAPSAAAHGSIVVEDPATQTSETLTDSSGGTASNTIAAVSGTGADATINDNNASLVDEINKLRADVASLRAQLVALLASQRITGGVGILADNP